MSNIPSTSRSATPWGAIIPLVSALLYGVSPIDLIPDLIPLLGFVDDALIVPIMLLFAFLQYRRARTRKSVATDKIIVMPTQSR